MESANFHQQQQQQDHQLVVDSSSFRTPSSCYGLSWSQNPILNSTSNDINSRDLKQHIHTNIDLMPCPNTGTQDLRFPWNASNNTNVTSNPMDNFMTHELQRLAQIKNEFSGSESYPKFSEMINSSPTSSIEDVHLYPSPGYNNNQDLLCQMKSSQHINEFTSSGELIAYSNNNTPNNHSQNCSSGMTSRGSFSQIFPTINISSLNQSSAAAAAVADSLSAFDMNLPALDLFGSSRFNGNFSHPSSFNALQLGSLFKDTCLSYGLDQMHQPNHRPIVCPSKISSTFTTGSSTEAKRPASNYVDAKAPQSTAPKKSKLEPRASCAPFKVRKEKLGDRIAALQQLVAPFGKTDTASVLMEAIGYIKFLQSQVETLSVPYMKSTHKATKTSTQQRGSMEDGNEEAKRDLRSRGLCLVPLSCLSYVTDGGGGVWPAP